MSKLQVVNTRWVIRFKESSTHVIHYFSHDLELRTLKHSFSPLTEVPVNIVQSKDNPKPEFVDIELSSGNMIYCVPTNSFTVLS